MSDFLSKLNNQLASQFSLGENERKVINLGEFSKQVDKSAERRYVEEGYLRVDPYNSNPKQLEIMLQEPTATVLVKKKMFSSLAENFRPDYMDAEEKLYYKSIKVLLQNKCNQIAALEKLSKIQKVSSAYGNINEQLLPAIFSLSDVLSNGFGEGILGGSNPFGNTSVGELGKTVDRVRQLYAYNGPSNITKWITDPTNLVKSDFGEGTGVIEITNFSNFTTNCSVNLDPSSFSLTIEDPYQVMTITSYDIERAIADANNFFNNSQVFQFGKENIDQIIDNTKNELNKVRSLRKASPISIRVNPDTLIGKRVIALIDRTGMEIVFNYDESGGGIFPGLGGATNNSVHINEGYLRGGLFAEEEGLDSAASQSIYRNKKAESEASIFKRLIASIFSKMQLEANARAAIIQNNKDTNYIRRKLNFNFLGKLIIQEQDPIHIYINSKARFDNKILAGMKSTMSGVGILQNLNNTITDFKNAANNLFNPGGSVPLQVEKAIYVGEDFPNHLWNVLRDQFVTEKEGTHVYAGIIQTANENYSAGKFTVTVTGADNADYFNQGKINFKPSVDTFNGTMYDPLTPFKTDFENVGGVSKKQVPELLDENNAIIKAGILKKKMGPFAGEKIKSNNYIEDASIDKYTGLASKTFYAPDGLVNKWKEGIGVFTQFGSSQDINDPNRAGPINIYEEPFAGLDIMNVLSLLISGVPYNFATYYKATGDMSSFSNDPQSKQSAANTFYDSLKQGLTKSNNLWGNFIPFKNLVMDEQSYVKALSAQFAINTQNKDLDKKLQDLNELNSNIMLYGAVNYLSANAEYYTDQFTRLKEQAKSLTSDINKAIDNINTDEKIYQNIFGENVSFDDEFANTSDPNKAANSPEMRRHLRRKTNLLTRRMSYDVRGNVDKNLFIVDDTYDKDYDIMAYNKKLSGNMSLFNSSILSPMEKIKATADLLNLEVFCDTQGHIRVRSPQYNRMPSSIFYRMMYLKDSSGVQIFPQFLSDFFNNQLETLRARVEIIEDQIRLDCAILGYQNDSDATKFLISGNNLEGNGQAFAFISDANSGLITEIDGLLNQSNPNEGSIFGGDNDQSLSNYQNIKLQAISTKNIFTNSQRYSSLVKVLSDQLLKSDGSNPNSNDIANLESNSVISNLIARIQNKSGTKVSLENYTATVTAGVKNVEFGTTNRVDVFKATKELGSKLKERQKAMKLFYEVIKNTVEYRSLDNGMSATKLFPTGNYGNSHVPEVYEHMIEDESYDDYGVGSGLRYIIKASQIREMNIGSRAPDYTTVQVNGIVSDFDLTPIPGAELQQGNAQTTAIAVDYDMWRTYGFKSASPVILPLQDAESQVAPYASMILSRARKNILRGTITINGNEFMQPGEVIYLEPRSLLFYVEEVSHQFSYGSQFTTTLTLSYGHTPGEYIPTYLDVIGKMIYKNRDIADIAVQRQDNSRNDSSIGSVSRKSNSVLSLSSDADSEFTPEDMQVIKNMMYYASYKMAGSQENDKLKTILELRIYHNDANGPNSQLQSFANTIRNMVIGESMSMDLSLDSGAGASKIVPKELVKVVTVNLDSKSDHRSPSQKAISSARNIAENGTIKVSGDTDRSKMGDKITESLFGYIVDCWITVEENKGNK